MKTKLIIGLGNPGEKYEKTRHNVGFLALDSFANEHGLTFKKEYNMLYSRYEDLVLVKPLTFMNLSGNIIDYLVRKFSTDEVLVIFDDIYLTVGDLRLRKKGSAGGHNGLKSIIKNLERNDFYRFKIGIGRNTQIPLEKFVLGRLNMNDFLCLRNTFKFINELLEIYSRMSFQQTMDYFSKNKKSYSDKIEEIRSC